MYTTVLSITLVDSWKGKNQSLSRVGTNSLQEQIQISEVRTMYNTTTLKKNICVQGWVHEFC